MSFDFPTALDWVTDPVSYFSERGEDYKKYCPIYPASAIASSTVAGMNNRPVGK